MEGKPGNLPRVADDVMPPLEPARDTYLRMFLSRGAEHGAVRYTRVEQWEVIGAQPARVSVKRARAPLVLGAALLVIATALVTWWLTARTSQPKNPPRVTVSLDPGKTAPDPSPSPVPVTAPGKLAAAAPIAAVPTVSVPAEDTSGVPQTEKAALDRAFATNEAWPWQNGATRGLVVVGPGEIVAGRLCRDVAIMTRADGIPDRTINSRKCQEPGGAIVDGGTPAG